MEGEGGRVGVKGWWVGDLNLIMIIGRNLLHETYPAKDSEILE